MSDAPATGGLTTDAVPAGITANQSPPPAATPTVASPPSADPLDADLPADRAVFDRGYVESIRKEAQRYREEAKSAAQYDAVFGQYDEPDREVWMDLARTWATDPNRAAEIMQQIAGNVLGEAVAGAGSAGAAGPGGLPDPVEQELTASEQLTPERVQELIDAKFSAQEAQRAEARAIEDVYSEVRTAGFDPDSAEGFMVLWNANHFTNGNITEAVKMTNTYKQSIIDGYVQGRSSGKLPMPTANGAPATGLGEPIKNLDDAKKATEAFLRERRGAS
jgi:hypothetical protein